jgi:mRNA interferase RelE/StbE
MPKQILLSTPAQKQFGKLDNEIKKRVKNALHRLADSGAGDIKEMKGIKGGADLYRLRVGDYRLVYSLDSDAIRITQIFHRGKGYDWL